MNVKEPKRVTLTEDRFTTSELSKKWKVSDKTIQRIPISELPYIKIGRQNRYRPADVVAYEERNLVTQNS